MSREKILEWCVVSIFLSWAIMCYICYDKSIENEQLITKHNSALIELNAKLDESVWWASIVFDEGADITNKYNELKKQCRKVVKR